MYFKGGKIMTNRVHVQDAYDILGFLSNTIQENKDYYSEQESMSILTKMNQLSNQMDKIKKAAQEKDRGAR
tara:strand:- start:463 stop:675 length:213 start_codon:yes stop_codon:yes gene_type:complete